jgi:hypothetical protein
MGRWNITKLRVGNVLKYTLAFCVSVTIEYKEAPRLNPSSYFPEVPKPRTTIRGLARRFNSGG